MSVAATPKMDERECTRCHVTKPLNQKYFTRVGIKHGAGAKGLDSMGNPLYTKICNDCVRLKQRATTDAKTKKREEYEAWRAAQRASSDVKIGR